MQRSRRWRWLESLTASLNCCWRYEDEPAAAHNDPTVATRLFAGLALRWWAIHDNHQRFTRGPCAWARHPSYTGALLAFLSLALLIEHRRALLLMSLPVTAAFLSRIHVEEAVLARVFGSDLTAHSTRTWRLITGLY